MTRPHFFVWSGGVINLDKVVSAEILTRDITILVIDMDAMDGGEMAEPKQVFLDDEHVIGRFMLHCARFHEDFEFYASATELKAWPWDKEGKAP